MGPRFHRGHCHIVFVVNRAQTTDRVQRRDGVTSWAALSVNPPSCDIANACRYSGQTSAADINNVSNNNIVVVLIGIIKSKSFIQEEIIIDKILNITNIKMNNIV